MGAQGCNVSFQEPTVPRESQRARPKPSLLEMCEALQCSVVCCSAPCVPPCQWTFLQRECLCRERRGRDRRRYWDPLVRPASDPAEKQHAVPSHTGLCLRVVWRPRCCGTSDVPGPCDHDRCNVLCWLRHGLLRLCGVGVCVRRVSLAGPRTSTVGLVLLHPHTFVVRWCSWHRVADNRSRLARLLCCSHVLLHGSVGASGLDRCAVGLAAIQRSFICGDTQTVVSA